MQKVHVDQFIRTHEASWTELDELVRRLRSPRQRRHLADHDIDRAIELYQQVSAQLSSARTWYGDSPLTARLTILVSEARAVIYGTGDSGGGAVRRFFLDEFPTAVWDARRFIAVAAALVFLPAFYVAVWMSNSDAALEASGPEAVRTEYIEQDFEAYYSSEPAAQFSTEVLINNIQVSFLAYALGIFGAIGTVIVLVFNGMFVGEAAGLFHAAGQPGKFWGLILPHGLIELTAVCVAGGAGLKLGWSMIAPGDRTRIEALGDEGRQSVPIVLGLILVFVIAGLVEGFVTPSGLPTAARVGIGVLVEVAFIAYIVGFGRRVAASAGDAAADHSRPEVLTSR